MWMSRYPRSPKNHENERYWCTRQMTGLLHAVIVSLLALPTLFYLIFAPRHQRYEIAHDLTWCSGSPDQEIFNILVAAAGLAFTTFTVSDLVVCSIHGLMTPDYVVHHVVFITAGCIIRGNCMLPFQSSVLMAMEVSTPFLNYLQLIRNRGAAFEKPLRINGILFMLSFVVFRLILNTYGAIDLLFNIAYAMREAPAWQGWFLVVAITVGMLLQFYWFKPILNKFFEIKNSLKKEPQNGYEKLENGA
mmetsp:Transcript_46278/g.85008  ORF Transcript_46278/g.85008 Transcript_46278/m.85008 type:complete len:247 (+) Transcript_46278:228-968(+)